MPATSMPWVKLYTDYCHDTKVLRLSRSEKLTFIQLLLLAGECDCEGALVDGSEIMQKEDIARWLREDFQTISADMDTLERVGMVQWVDGVCIVTNFEKRQGRPQSERQARWREAQAKHRTPPIVATPDPAVSDTTPAPVIDDTENVSDDRKNVSVLEGEEEEEKSKSKKKNCADAHTNPRDLLFDAIAEVTQSNPKLMGGRIAKTAKELRKVNATPEQVRQVAAYFKAYDFRGKKGETITLAQLISEWEKGKNYTGTAASAGKRSNWDIAMQQLIDAEVTQ